MMTDNEMIAFFERVGLIPGEHWKLVKINGKPEIVVSIPGMRLLAEYAPDDAFAAALMAALEERFPGQ